MSGRLRCPECGDPLAIVKGRASEVRPSPLGALRDKRCRACGYRTTTVELTVGDIPRLLDVYMRQDRNN